MAITKRAAARWAAALGLVGASAGLGFAAAAIANQQPTGKVIQVTARRFVFIPREITLKKGEMVTLEIHTEDVLMGFNAPDFSKRTDIPPGQVMHVTFTPDKTGTFTFLCDIFCGSGHENMDGTIKVVE